MKFKFEFEFLFVLKMDYTRANCIFLFAIIRFAIDTEWKKLNPFLHRY